MNLRMSPTDPMKELSCYDYGNHSLIMKTKEVCPTFEAECIYQLLLKYYVFTFTVHDLQHALESYRDDPVNEDFKQLGVIHLRGVNCFEVESVDEYVKTCYKYLKMYLPLRGLKNYLKTHRVWKVEGGILSRQPDHPGGMKALVAATGAVDITSEVNKFLPPDEQFVD
jgi:hypothetical protein